MNQLSSNYLNTSGVCIFNRPEQEQRVYRNPKLGDPTSFFLEPLSKPELVRAPIYSQYEFDKYAEALQKAGERLGFETPDLVLLPLRGSVRPWEHLRIYCNLPLSLAVPFPFSDKEKQSAETFEIIYSAITLHADKERLSIIVIDTAKGGYGTRKLLDILEELHGSSKQSWFISFYLFVPIAFEHAEWPREHRRRSKSTFVVNVYPYFVPSLIGEDYDPAMIVRGNFGPTREMKLLTPTITYRLTTNEFPKVIDQILTEATHELHLTEQYCLVKDISQAGDYLGYK